MKKNNVLKGSIIILMLILFILSVSNVSADDNEDIKILTLSKAGITINYPSNWGNSRAVSGYSIMAISKLDSIDSFGIGQVNINVEKKPVEGDFYSFVNKTYKAMEYSSSFDLVSSGGIVLDGKDALEYIYTSKDNSGIQKEHKAIWFEKGGQAYVILYSAPLDQFESNLYVFDYILSEMQIT